jgi:pectate lyase
MSELLIIRDNGDIYPGFNGGGTTTGASSKGYNGNGGSSSSDDGDFFGMIFKGSSSQAAPLAPYSSIVFVSTFLSLLIIFILDTTTNYDILL